MRKAYGQNINIFVTFYNFLFYEDKVRNPNDIDA